MSVFSISGSLVSGWVVQDGNSEACGVPAGVSREQEERGHVQAAGFGGAKTSK